MTDIRSLLESLRSKPADSGAPPTTKTQIAGASGAPRKISRWADLAGATGPESLKSTGSGVKEESPPSGLAEQVAVTRNVATIAKKMVKDSPEELDPFVTVSFSSQFSKSLKNFMVEKIDIAVPR